MSQIVKHRTRQRPFLSLIQRLPAWVAIPLAMMVWLPLSKTTEYVTPEPASSIDVILMLPVG